MIKWFVGMIVIVLSVASVMQQESVALERSDTCNALMNAPLVNSPLAGIKVTAAMLITPSPSWASPVGQGRAATVTQPFCRVEAVLEGRVGLELWLPTADRWNGRWRRG
jgi:hypothetical protein